MRVFRVLVVGLMCAQGLAQGAPEPQVHADRSVTFRYVDAAASKVAVVFAEREPAVPMHKDAGGVWTVTTEPLPAEIYAYRLEVDGRKLIDQGNPSVRWSTVGVANTFLVAGEKPEAWETTAVAHGTVHHHAYTSKVVVGLKDGQSDMYVYTPPGYDARAARKYPVLYLLHGWSQGTDDWTFIGHANDVLDNLIAQGKARPMVVVMPNGYGDMSFVRNGFGVWRDKEAIRQNVGLFQRSLVTEVVPQVESMYNVSTDRRERAIAGLSMGGLESLVVGLGDTAQFAWIGGFSAAVSAQVPASLAGLDAKTADLRLLWIACGTSDDLIAANRGFAAGLKAQGLPVTEVETPGAHTWLVWRDNLVHFVPLLFQTK